MAEYTQFVLGVLGADFEGLKTSDNVYLKDLLADDIESSLAEYNSRELALSRLLCKKYDDKSSQMKRTFTDDAFEEIGELQTPGMYSSFDVWNYPVPIKRLGSLTKMTRERVKLMTSKQFLNFHNGKLEADMARITKEMFESAMLKTPTARVDALDGLATTKKAFWNDEASMDTPRSNGQITFDGDHQHYNPVSAGGSIGSAGADLQTYLLDHIQEHRGLSGAQIIFWARYGTTVNYIRNESTYFKGVHEASEILGLVNPSYNATGQTQALIASAKNLGYNIRIVGTWKDAIVISTPDIPANYIMATAYMGQNDQNSPMAWREHPAFKGLVIEDPSGGNPIIGKDAQYRRYLGLGVNNRSAGAVLYTGDTSWAEPSFS